MQKALQKAFEKSDKIELGRIKLDIHGEGATGKTSTLYSLLGRDPVVEHLSTGVADLHNDSVSTHHATQNWQEVTLQNVGYSKFTTSIVAKRLVGKKK